jgi:Fur family ferric uptake transcriptional regulator
MITAKESLQALLKRQGYSVTTARQRVFHALAGQEPLTMSQLAGRARGVDRATVYRTVNLFEQLGVVQRLNIGWKYKLELTDKFIEHHHHLTCTNCGQTVVLNEDEPERFIDQLARAYDFTPTAHQIEIQGICSSCN